VENPIWIAISVYVLIAIIRKRLKVDISLYTFLQILMSRFLKKSPYSVGYKLDYNKNPPSQQRAV